MKKIINSIFLMLLAVGISFSPIKTLNLQAKEYQRGGTPNGVFTETIYYETRNEEKYVNPLALPVYNSGMSCGITSGGVAMAYFSKNNSGLIPNHLTGQTILGKWAWTGQNASSSNMEYVHNQLYTRMNATVNGVTISGYLGGMSSFAASHSNYTFTSEKTMGINGTLDNKYKEALQSGKLLAIFIDGFNSMQLGSGLINYSDSKYESVHMELYNGAHIMTAYGYSEITYTDGLGQTRKDTYLYVHAGFTSLGMVRLNSHITIDDCYIMNIA